MKLNTLVLLLMFLAAVGRSQDAHVEARNRAMRQLAVRAAAQKVVDSLQTPPEPTEEDMRRLVADLGADMMANVDTHCDPAASRTLCVRLLAEQRRRALDQWIDDAVARAREQTDLPLRREDVLELIGDDWEKRVTSDANQFADRHIDEAFTRSRKQSVAIQRDELKGRIRMPEQNALESKLAEIASPPGKPLPPPDALDTLTGWLASFAAPPDRPLFKEVTHSTREAAQRVLDHVKKQYTHQMEALRGAADALPENVLDANSIRKALLESVDTAVKALQVEEMYNPPGERATIYGPLAPVCKEADHMADTLEEARFDAAIKAQENVPLAPAVVESAVRSNLTAHRSAKASRQLLLDRYVDELKPWFTERLVVRARRVGDGLFATRVDTLLTRSKRLAGSLRDRVAAQLDLVLPDIRARIATDQLRAAFGELPAEIAALMPESVEALWAAGRCDTVKTFEAAWQAVRDAELIGPDTNPQHLVDEARNEVVETCNRLVPAACRAMREQINRLTILEGDWTPRLREDVDSGRPIEKIVSDWTRELDRRWRDHAEEQEIPYPDLFALTIDLVDKTVRKLYESTEKDLAEATTEATEVQEEAPPAPEEPAPEEPAPEEPETIEETPTEETAAVSVQDLLETLDFVLFFRDTPDGQAEAVLLDGSGASTRILFHPDHVQPAVDAVFTGILPALESATLGKAEQRPKRTGLLSLFGGSRPLDLKVAVLVGSKQVRHMTSILLRHRVELFVEDWNANPANRPIELEWEDNLEVAP